jgi:hypothetical protein
MYRWKHPTLADTGATAPVRCRCRRPRMPAEMYDVAGLPGTDGATYLCAACLEDLHRQELLDRVELHRAKGAPAEWLAWWEAKLLRGPLERTGLPQHVLGEKLAIELDAALEKARIQDEAQASVPSGPTLEERIAALEAQLAGLVDGAAPG